MQIITYEPKKFRWEYAYGRPYHSTERRWFLYHEDIVEPVIITSIRHALEYLKDMNHPAWIWLRDLMSSTRETIELRPWAPVEVQPYLVEAMGEGFVDRVERKQHDCKVWDLVNGHVWLHMMGDAAR